MLDRVFDKLERLRDDETKMTFSDYLVLLVCCVAGLALLAGVLALLHLFI